MTSREPSRPVEAAAVPEGAAPGTGGNELGRAARGGAVTFVGAAASAAAGFTFSLLLARLFGATDAGVVLQAVALLTIGASLARLGLDTTAVWLLPRLRAEEPALIRPAVALMLSTATLGSLVVMVVWLGLRVVWPRAGAGDQVVRVVDALVLLLPLGVAMAVALACTRAFGQIVAFNLVDNVLVPVLRPGLLVVVHVLGGGVVLAALAWGLPWVAGLAAVAYVLVRCLARTTPPGGWRRADRSLRRRVSGYAAPRAFAQAMEQSLIWLDVLLVGVIAGSAAAGVYGSAARFVAAGVIVATALRIVVAPRFSALLAQGRTSEVARLYVVTARWILLLGSPVHLTLAVFAPTVLAWLGPEFTDGAAALTVLCAGSVVVLAAGNVQALLLMSGGSAAGAFNKAVVLVVNVVGNVLLVPRWGIEAAAAVWAASMVLDTVLASYQVHRLTGIALAWGSVLRVGVGVLVCVGGPLYATGLVLGQGTVPLVIGIALGAVGLLAYTVADRRLLHLHELRSLVGR